MGVIDAKFLRFIQMFSWIYILQIAFLWHIGVFLITLSAMVPVVDAF